MNMIKPINYRICLEPDLERFMFTGNTEILLEADRPVREVCLNAAELAIWTCKVRLGDALVDCPFSFDPAKEELRIHLPEEMTGRISLAIDYLGKINAQMAGFYRSKYVLEEQERYIAVTQFEESDARRAFPCLDRPRDPGCRSIQGY